DSSQTTFAGTKVVKPFQFAVRFDEHIQGGDITYGFYVALASHDDPCYVPQIADVDVQGPVIPPVVENRNQEVGTRGGTIELADGCDIVVSEMRQYVSNSLTADLDKVT